MSRRRKPTYTLHKATGQARVRVNGKDHYLGRFGSPESRDEYDRLIGQWCRGQDHEAQRLTVDGLALLYVDHADQYYQKNGKPTGEAKNIRYAIKYAIGLFGTSRAHDFGPIKLKAARQAMIDHGLARTRINRDVARIKALFKWGVENEHVPVTVYQALQAVAGLRRGRSEAREPEPVKPAPEAFVDAVQPHVTQPIWGAIQLQRFTGCRPGEALAIRGCDLNMSGAIWEYKPESHKTEHFGKDRLIFLGPQAQAVVREFLKPDLEAYLFSPRDGRESFVESSYRPGAKSQQRGKRMPRERYGTESYHGAIRSACIRADVPHWHPNQLRHNAATNLRREFGIEAARIILGHSTAFTTEIYAEVDHAKAREIVARIG